MKDEGPEDSRIGLKTTITKHTNDDVSNMNHHYMFFLHIYIFR